MSVNKSEHSQHILAILNPVVYSLFCVNSKGRLDKTIRELIKQTISVDGKCSMQLIEEVIADFKRFVLDPLDMLRYSDEYPMDRPERVKSITRDAAINMRHLMESGAGLDIPSAMLTAAVLEQHEMESCSHASIVVYGEPMCICCGKRIYMSEMVFILPSEDSSPTWVYDGGELCKTTVGFPELGSIYIAASNDHVKPPLLLDQLDCLLTLVGTDARELVKAYHAISLVRKN